MDQPAIRINNLTKVYTAGRRAGGSVTAVQDLNLTVARGEIFGLLGPNGAGKTTTVRMICGLIAPTAGSIHVDGFSTRDDPAKVRSLIGLLPEDAGDYKNLTLAEELEYHGAMYGLDAATVRRRSDPLLDRLGLRDRANQRLKTFSRGMRRKFHIIRALLHHPRLLLLDEPTAGLDPSIVEEVWDLLKALVAERGATVVLCSHHLEEVERLCSRVAILNRRLLIEGTLAELSGRDGRHRLELRDVASAMATAVGRVAGVAEVNANGEGRGNDGSDNILHFTVAAGGDARQIVPEVVRSVVEAGGRILSLTRDGQDLRSLYRSFVATGNDGGGGAKSVADRSADPGAAAHA